jgi:hypothetical protein
MRDKGGKKMGKAIKFGVGAFEAGAPTPALFNWVEVVDFNDDGNTLTELYRVGEWSLVEVAASGKYGATSVVLWCDEEGLYNEPVIRNQAATSLRNEILGGVFDGIYGNCVLTAEDEDGKTLALNEEQVAEIKTLLELGNYPMA